MERMSRWRVAGAAMVATAAVLIGIIPSMSTAAPAAAASDGQMIMPASGTIQSKVGDGCRGTSRPTHDGIDISGQGGTPILAAYDGVIKTRAYSSGYGYYVEVSHTGGYVTRYAHMVSQALVAPGARVTRGQQLGVVGSTGNSTGAHLHFEVWRSGSVYAAINQGFTCLSKVTRGNPIPVVIPGLGTATNTPTLNGDFNGDGKADLFGLAGDSDLKFLAGDGRGGFAPASVVTSGWGLYRHLTHTDLNGDGRSDLLAVRSDGLLEYYGGGPSGGFDRQDRLGLGWYDMLHVVSGADYTGDGRHDVVAASADGTLVVYSGNGSGGLTSTPTTVGSGWQGIRLIVGGDFNGDRLGDIVAVANDGTLYFYRGTGNGFSGRVAVGPGWAGFTALTGGVDYDGDGRADLVARSANGDLYLYAGDGVGKFGSGRLISSGWSGYLQLE